MYAEVCVLPAQCFSASSAKSCASLFASVTGKRVHALYATHPLASALSSPTHHQGLSNPARAAPQDVILRGGRQHPLFARVADAHAPAAIVLPAQPERGVQVRGKGRNRAQGSFDRLHAWRNQCHSGKGGREM